eukprot:SAG22_NODE_10199_length_548_cov_0.783964_2_plen_62_part_01
MKKGFWRQQFRDKNLKKHFFLSHYQVSGGRGLASLLLLACLPALRPYHGSSLDPPIAAATP